LEGTDSAGATQQIEGEAETSTEDKKTKWAYVGSARHRHILAALAISDTGHKFSVCQFGLASRVADHKKKM
jgi:hypothetical protein